MARMDIEETERVVDHDPVKRDKEERRLVPHFRRKVHMVHLEHRHPDPVAENPPRSMSEIKIPGPG